MQKYYRCPPWTADFLRCVSSSASMSAVMKPRHWGLVEDFIQNPTTDTAMALTEAHAKCIAPACCHIVTHAKVDNVTKAKFIDLLRAMQHV